MRTLWDAWGEVYFPSQVTELNDLSFIRALRAELGKEVQLMGAHEILEALVAERDRRWTN